MRNVVEKERKSLRKVGKHELEHKYETPCFNLFFFSPSIPLLFISSPSTVVVPSNLSPFLGTLGGRSTQQVTKGSPRLE
jgi:hypothetical protein